MSDRNPISHFLSDYSIDLPFVQTCLSVPKEKVCHTAMDQIRTTMLLWQSTNSKDQVRCAPRRCIILARLDVLADTCHVVAGDLGLVMAHVTVLGHSLRQHVS